MIYSLQYYCTKLGNILLLLRRLFTIPNLGLTPPGIYYRNARGSDTFRGATVSGPEH